MKVNYNRKGQRVATQRSRGTGFTMVKAQLILCALATTAICMILGSM